MGAGIGIATAALNDTDVGGHDWGDSTVYGTATFGYRYQKPRAA